MSAVDGGVCVTLCDKVEGEPHNWLVVEVTLPGLYQQHVRGLIEDNTLHIRGARGPGDEPSHTSIQSNVW